MKIKIIFITFLEDLSSGKLTADFKATLGKLFV